MKHLLAQLFFVLAFVIAAPFPAVAQDPDAEELAELLNGFIRLSESNLEAFSAADSAGLDPERDQFMIEVIEQIRAGCLLLQGVTSLNPGQASALAAFTGQFLFLPDLRSLDAGSAGKLARWRGDGLSLSGLHTLDAATAGALSRWRGRCLLLDGLTALDAGTAAKLAQWPGFWLHLNGLTALMGSTTDKPNTSTSVGNTATSQAASSAAMSLRKPIT